MGQRVSFPAVIRAHEWQKIGNCVQFAFDVLRGNAAPVLE
jgi:hypothetical protein